MSRISIYAFNSGSEDFIQLSLSRESYSDAIEKARNTVHNYGRAGQILMQCYKPIAFVDGVSRDMKWDEIMGEPSQAAAQA